MNKLKMLALAALVAATVGIGALAAAPSASAQPPFFCKALIQAADRYRLLAEATPGGLWGWPFLHWYYVNKSADYAESYVLAGCS